MHLEMRQMRHTVSCIAALLLTAAASGPAIADTQVVLYSANDDTVNKLVVDGLKKEPGLTVNVVSTGSGVLFRRIAPEAANRKGDVARGASPPRPKQISKCSRRSPGHGLDAGPRQCDA